MTAKKRATCMNCAASVAERNDVHDAYACHACDEWLEDKCGDVTCEFCTSRPAKPSGQTNGWGVDGFVVHRATDEALAASRAKLDRLRGIADDFYVAACAAGVHSFIEHTGLMNEHIKLLHLAASAGVDPEHISRHGAAAVPMAGYHAKYLGEKFGCMFSRFFTPETWMAFRKTVEADFE